jgi:predicted DNA-binding ribbon-helix-helix protein
MAALRKRSVTVSGHRTSVSLEAPFWDALRGIAAEEGRSLNDLVSEVDRGRDPGTGLSSALRLRALARWRPARD